MIISDWSQPHSTPFFGDAANFNGVEVCWSGKTLCRKPKNEAPFSSPLFESRSARVPLRWRAPPAIYVQCHCKSPPKQMEKLDGTCRNHHELHILEQLFYLLGVHYIHRLWRYVTCQCVVTLSMFGLGAHHCRSLQILSRGSHSGWTRQTLTEYSYSTTMWGPQDS